MFLLSDIGKPCFIKITSHSKGYHKETYEFFELKVEGYDPVTNEVRVRFPSGELHHIDKSIIKFTG